MNAMSKALFPLSGVYALGRKVHVAWSKSRDEGKVPVIIVGNLTVGGTGKTPLVAYFADFCRRAKMKCAVISRGYKGSRDKDPAIVSDGRRVLMGPGRAGDEAFMLAGMLENVPIVVGRERLHACALAVKRLGAEILVLDDGFQQRHRFPGAFCALAINSRQPLFEGRLLPAGFLREPVSAAAEAQALILTHGAPAKMRRRLERIAPHALVAGAKHRLAGISPLFGRGVAPATGLKGMSVIALSAIGFPEGFASLLKGQAGVRRVISRPKPDHHAWKKSEIEDAMKLAIREGCHAVIVTAKDAVKMPRPAKIHMPIYYARIRMEFANTEGRRLERRLGGYLRLFRA